MPKRDADLLLEDIHSAIGRIERYIAGLDHAKFLQDEKTIDAVVRNLEIIGEAVRWLPQEFKDQHPSVPWSQIAGLRNRIVHDYFGLDLEIIWQVLATSLPEFKQQLARIR
ncbi:MAG TPA: DUF86 domain-containing protein [Chthoniobacteraceae bacterium]|nr:DUF86 domain-containing protein [Chthoniobacteraceae bacterium]